MRTKVWSYYVKRRAHLEDTSIEGRILLNGNPEKSFMTVWTGFIWFTAKLSGIHW